MGRPRKLMGDYRQFAARLPEGLYDELQAFSRADAERRSMNDVVVTAVTEWLASNHPATR